MSSEPASTAAVEDQVRRFLRQNLPQIEMHGGDASIVDLDPAAGTVSIRLAGACSGCGISPMTIQAIKQRLPQEVPAIEEAFVETGSAEPDHGAEPGGDDGGSHGMGHPAGGGVSLDYEGEIPEWRKQD